MFRTDLLRQMPTCVAGELFLTGFTGSPVCNGSSNLPSVFDDLAIFVCYIQPILKEKWATTILGFMA